MLLKVKRGKIRTAKFVGPIKSYNKITGMQILKVTTREVFIKREITHERRDFSSGKSK